LSVSAATGIARLHFRRRLARDAHRFLHARLRHQHPAGRITRLADVVHAQLRSGAHRGFEVGVVEDHVRRFAAEFQGHALDRRRRQARDLGTGPRRPRKGNQIHFRVRGHVGPHFRSSAIDEVEHPRGHARLVHDLGEDVG
jgi:hypothetical protein